MKNHLTFKSIFLAIISVFVFATSFQTINAQSVKKNKLRIKGQYIHIMDGQAYLDLKTTAKVDKKNIKVSDADLYVFNELEEGSIELGKATTNAKGEAIYIFKDLNLLKADSSFVYNLLVSFKGNDHFKKAKKRISFKKVIIEAKLISKDSINYISAKLSDPITKEAVASTPLTIQVQRLYDPLILGEEFNETDENGEILIPVEDGIPGIDGIINLEVVLNDSDDYGTIKAIVKAPIGKVIVDESTFDQRTMWSPRNKTPIFLLIIPNLLIIGIWGLIIYLIINLFKISKSKN
ncbi:MAG: hypothetical protein L3J09_03920 [Flavobacteriaceae bacterium]|nr:hypothetical protein [Flavobacteriaceae bacterium]